MDEIMGLMADSMEQLPGVCIMVLCGIPASGKSTFARKLKQFLQQRLAYCVIHVSYDELMPWRVEQQLIEDTKNQSYSKWKTYRQHIVHAVDQTIAVLLEHGPISDLGSLQRDCPAEFLEGWHKHVLNDLSTQAESPSFRDSSKVILVDDNMFYRSMRYQYFQIARNYSVGFAQVYLTSDLDESLMRNSLRDDAVASNVISTMLQRIQPPCKDNMWEHYSMQWRSEQGDLEPVLALIEEAIKNPVSPLTEDDPSVAEESRSRCAQSALHQIDQILRKLVSNQMTLAKGSVGADMQTYAKQVLRIRSDLMEEFQSGSLLVSDEILQDVTHASKNPDHPLFCFVQSLFSERCSAIT